jgi:CelD/BcsL family acetyltransferase involved in cellulose biosynthesis
VAFHLTSTESDVAAIEDGARSVLDVRQVEDAAEWDALIAACPMPHLPQAFAYGQAKAASGWTARRIVLSENGNPIAIVTILELRRFGLKLLNRVNRGPIFLGANPSDAQVLSVYQTLRRYWGRLWAAPLLIAPALERGERADRLLREAGYRRRSAQSWLSGRIDLAADETALWGGLSSTFRNRVRNAEKAGAVVEIADTAEAYEWMIARHLENMKEKGFSAFDGAMLRTLRESAPGQVLVFRLMHSGEPVAGMSVVRFGGMAEYHVGWFGPAGRKLNAGNFLMWNIIRELKRRGVGGFDVGGMKPGDGYTRFKRTMNPVEYELAGEWMSF